MNNVRVNGKHLILNKKKIYIYGFWSIFREREKNLREKKEKERKKEKINCWDNILLLKFEPNMTTNGIPRTEFNMNYKHRLSFNHKR